MREVDAAMNRLAQVLALWLLTGGLAQGADVNRPEPEPVPEPPPPITGEAPRELVDRVLRDAAALAGVNPSSLRVVRDESVTWPDGALGCGEPGREYIQMLVPGYWIVVALGDRQFDYRSDARGNYRLCAAGRGRPPVGELTAK